MFDDDIYCGKEEGFFCNFPQLAVLAFPREFAEI